MTEYEPREFSISGTLHGPAFVGAEQLAESLKRGLEQSAQGATVDLGDFTKYATDDEAEGSPCCYCGGHHPATACAEREDETDAYVEPEPLKEGDWVQVWAQVGGTEPDEDGDIPLEISDGSACTHYTYGHLGTIVRPDAGQVPPWVKPARCTSLWADPFAADPTTLRRCKFDAGHDERHRADWSAPTGHNQTATWADDSAYGRVEVSS